jgi:hypothetical protein
MCASRAHRSAPARSISRGRVSLTALAVSFTSVTAAARPSLADETRTNLV